MTSKSSEPLSVQEMANHLDLANISLRSYFTDGDVNIQQASSTVQALAELSYIALKLHKLSGKEISDADEKKELAELVFKEGPEHVVNALAIVVASLKIIADHDVSLPLHEDRSNENLHATATRDSFQTLYNAVNETALRLCEAMQEHRAAAKEKFPYPAAEEDRETEHLRKIFTNQPRAMHLTTHKDLMHVLRAHDVRGKDVGEKVLKTIIEETQRELSQYLGPQLG